MNLTELKIIVQKLTTYKKIHYIERINDTTIAVTFEKDMPYYFDLTRGEGSIYQWDEIPKSRDYNAPFDVVLKKRFINAKIISIEVPKNDKILTIRTQSASSYKAVETLLQLEFTGRHTNAIILDSEGVILEALRHIDSYNSFREVRVGVKLLDLPPRTFEPKPPKINNIDNLEIYLRDLYREKEQKKLEEIKRNKIKILEKRCAKLEKIFSQLENETQLLQKASVFEQHASIILGNLDRVANYQKSVELEDYEGNQVRIELPKESVNAADAANRLFTRAKKLKQKAKGLHIERENLSQKILYTRRLIRLVQSAKSSAEIEIYLPKQPKVQKKRMQSDSGIETLFYQGYKILFGKNQKANAQLLKNAKMGDLWFHLRDIPSTHVIIRTDKRNIPEDVLEFAAKICVDFSIDESGVYWVDYTARRNVKVKEGAKVNYTDFKSMRILKE